MHKSPRNRKGEWQRLLGKQYAAGVRRAVAKAAVAAKAKARLAPNGQLDALRVRLAKVEGDLQHEAAMRRRFEGEAWALREEVQNLKQQHKDELFALRDQLRAARAAGQTAGAALGIPPRWRAAQVA